MDFVFAVRLIYCPTRVRATRRPDSADIAPGPGEAAAFSKTRRPAQRVSLHPSHVGGKTCDRKLEEPSLLAVSRWPLPHSLVCWLLAQRRERLRMTMTGASDASPWWTTGCTKPSSTMVGAASRPIIGGTSYTRPANAAGASAIVGGTKTVTVGTRIVTGTITTTITITTTNCRRSRGKQGGKELTDESRGAAIVLRAFASRWFVSGSPARSGSEVPGKPV